MLHIVSKWVKRWLLGLWILTFLSVFWWYLYNPSFFTATSLKVFLESFWSFLLLVYFVLSALRGFTLIPSTPFVLVGILLFPENLIFVYAISMIWILLSATMIYFFSKEMGFEQLLMKHHASTIKKCEYWTGKYGFLAVFIWSFLIIVPTDVICYIAGILRMNYSKFIIAVALWEGIICILLIFWGDSIVKIGEKIL